MKSLNPLIFIKKNQDYFLSKLKNKSRVYIVPNKHGLYFGFIIFSLFLMALSYGNNILLFLDFFLFSVFIFAQFSSHYNLHPLKINQIAIDDKFANVEVVIDLTIENKANFNLKKINLTLDKLENLIISDTINIPSKNLKKISINANNIKRGYYDITKIKLHTSYPLDIFYVWRFYNVNLQFYIYPEPQGLDLNQYFKQAHNLEIFEEYSHHSLFSAGDKFALIDWKNYAKTAILKIKNFTADIDIKLSLKFEDYLYLGVEPALSQIVKWTLQASYLGIPWEITIKNKTYTNSNNEILEIFRIMAKYD